MADELTIVVSIALGALLMWIVYNARKKMWYLETMNPRQHYEVGKEGKIIAHMTIADRHFHGVEAGKYKLLLLYGDLSTFSKPILSGKLEEMYIGVLARSLIGRKFVTKLEKFRFLDFLFRHIPSLSVKAYMMTGELISPQDVLDQCWSADKRDDALAEMKRRGLINPKILWIKPYPPEDKLKEIQTGTLMIPDLILNHEQEYVKVTMAQRETLVKIDKGIASLLKEVIVLEREIITSISDPFQVMSMIIVDRFRKIEGLGIEQLADRGSAQGIVQVAKRLKEYRKELTEALSEEIKPEEIEKIHAMSKRMTELEKKMDEITSRVVVAPQIKAPEK